MGEYGAEQARNIPDLYQSETDAWLSVMLENIVLYVQNVVNSYLKSTVESTMNFHLKPPRIKEKQGYILINLPF